MRSLPAALVLSTAMIAAAGGAGSAAPPTGPVKSTPATGTPHLPTSNTTMQIRQLKQCGSTMYAVGSFSSIIKGSTTYSRHGAFSFQAVSPYTVTNWDPNVNGTVDTIAFNNGNCSNAYLGGKFTQIGSTAVKNIAEVSTSSGGVVGGFASNAAGRVFTIASVHGHLLVGGAFTGINGSTAAPYFASLDPTTGKNDGYLALNISGNYVFTDDSGHASESNATKIYNQQVSPDGTRELVEGVFTTIGGQARRQVAMLDLGGGHATTDAWHATEFDSNCATNQPFYAQGAAWSPDGSAVYVGTNGYKPANGAGFSTGQPRAGLCDAMIAFPTTSGNVTHRWINYTGCDSLYTAAADASTVYFGGHQRWASNSKGCDYAGPGAVVAPGMVGVSPSTGGVTFNPTRDRGLGADDMLLTSAGLWIASDNYQGSNRCGGVANLAGICFLPYS
ncbi:MAG: hypothetical protein JO214_14865 [Frankiaceae bacterium]|nr:hypothetical protein [Frankiaceae bacterium]